MHWLGSRSLCGVRARPRLSGSARFHPFFGDQYLCHKGVLTARFLQDTHLSIMRDVGHEMERIFLLAVIFLIFGEERFLPREPIVD